MCFFLLDNIKKIQSLIFDEHVINKKISQSNNNVIITKNVVINENTTDLLKTKINNFHKPKEFSYFDDASSIFQSTISYSTNFSDYNSYDWPYSNISQHDRLKKSFVFEYEYEEVDEESDNIIEDEEFGNLIDDQDKYINCENDLKIEESKQEPFESSLKNLKNSPTNKLKKQCLEQSSMANIMENQSETEKKIIKMFNSQINAFPYFQLPSLDIKITTQTYNTQMANSSKFV